MKNYSRHDGSIVTDGNALVRSVVDRKESKKPMKKTDREEFRILRKLVEILEPHLVEEYKQSIATIGFLTEGTKQSIAKLERAKEILKGNGTLSKKTDREEFEELYREHRKDRFNAALRDPLRKSMCSFDYIDGVTQSDWEMFLLGKGTFHEWYPKDD